MGDFMDWVMTRNLISSATKRIRPKSTRVFKRSF